MNIENPNKFMSSLRKQGSRVYTRDSRWSLPRALTRGRNDTLALDNGFTLIEIIIALAIFAFAVTALVSFHARGYVNDGKARRLTTAVQLAKSKMVDLQLDVEKELNKGAFPEDKSESGEFEKPFEGYNWKAEIRRVELPMPPVSEGESGNGGVMQQMMQPITKQISEAVRELKLTIKWEEMGKPREFSVVTHIVKM